MAPNFFPQATWRHTIHFRKMRGNQHPNYEKTALGLVGNPYVYVEIALLNNV